MCVYLYSDHDRAFILVISTEKYVCSACAWVSVCIILCTCVRMCVRMPLSLIDVLEMFLSMYRKRNRHNEHLSLAVMVFK